MAQKPWWLPEGVEIQQVIDLHKSGLSYQKIVNELFIECNPKTLADFLQRRGIKSNNVFIDCVICGSSLGVKSSHNQKYCKTCIPDKTWLGRFHNNGLTKPQWEAMWQAQDGLCGLCEQPLEDSIDVDHCHRQGHIRSLLHSACNNGLGYLENDKFVAQAFRYIERHKR